MIDHYTAEKLNEFRKQEWEKLDRRGAFVEEGEKNLKPVKNRPRNVRLMDSLYGFFRKRRSRRKPL